MSYRISRNIEESVIEFLEDQLEENNWDKVFVIKSFSQVYKKWTTENPVICVNILNSSIVRKEIGSKTFNKTIAVNVRIFGTDDGIRLDLKDFIIDCLEDDIDYLEFTVENGKFVKKDPIGKISILRITRDEKELQNTENLVQADKFRHIISFECHVVLD